MLYSKYLKENDRLVINQQKYNNQLQKEKAEYYKEIIKDQIQQKNQQKNHERYIESQNQYQPICENTFRNQEQFQLKRKINQMHYIDDLQNQIEHKQYMRETERINTLNNESGLTGLEIDNKYMNKYLPSHDQYMNGVKRQIEEKKYTRMVQENQEKEQDRQYLEQVNQFFNNEQQRIRDYEQKKKIEYQDYIKREILNKENEKRIQRIKEEQEDQQIMMEKQMYY